MGHSDFVKLLGQLASLSQPQRGQVRSALDVLPRTSAAEIAGVIPSPNACPHCQAAGEQLRPWGHSHGLARMRCHACGKTSIALTGTPLAHLRKREQWLRYAQALIEGASVRQAAQCCGVDKNTAFVWRHRFLEAAATHRPAHEGGIVEADETFFRESFKGQRKLPRPARKRAGVGAHLERIAVLVVRDRSGQTADFRLEKIDAPHITAVLRPLVDKDAIAPSMSSKAYASLTGRSIFKMSTPTTVASSSGWDAFTGWLPSIWKATWAGAACWSAIAKASLPPFVWAKLWEDFNRNS